ncbi:hypothetical protein WQ59_26565 [Streptomyces sp. KE1]|nr:hypothetical protein WQ59_26565 [Streptomyces sp. KE1]
MIRREDPARRLGDATAAQLSRMCDDLVEAAALLGPEADEALARLRAPDLPEERILAELAHLEELMRRHGLVGGGSVSRGEADPGGTAYQSLPGLGPGRPLEEVYVCPAGLCDRVEIPRPGEAARPLCAVWACPLHRFRTDRLAPGADGSRSRHPRPRTDR